MCSGPVQYSSQTADALVKTGPGILYSVNMMTDTAAGHVIVYDNTAGSGNIIIEIDVGAGDSHSWSLPQGVAFGKGLYVVITGTGPRASLFFR